MRTEAEKMQQESQQPLLPNWIVNIGDELGKVVPISKHFSINRVPMKLRKVNEEAYSPRIVSIGPLHHGTSDLRPMKEHKRRYMVKLFHRTKKAIPSFIECGKAIENSTKMAREYYPEDINFDHDVLADMLLVDGCFILELFIRRWNPECTDESDPILNNAWMIPALQHDLALLENQIPFFVLEDIFKFISHDLVPASDCQRTLPPSVIPLALSFFYPELKGETINWERIPHSSHLLHLLHNFFDLPIDDKASPLDNEIWGFRRCATKLLQAGIQFEKGATEVNSLLVLEGSSPGVIRIPPLSVDSTTGSRLRNFIAFEQQCIGSAQKVTSYAFLMSSLIHSLADIELLESKGIIINKLVAVEDVWPHLDGIRKEVVRKDFYYSDLCKGVNAHSKSWCLWLTRLSSWKARWQKYWRALKHDYFSNPWSIISFIAAVLLLLFTGLAAVYGVLVYYKDGS